MSMCRQLMSLAEFNPKIIFDTLYRSACLRAISSQYSSQDPTASDWHCSRIEGHLIVLYRQLKHSDAAEIHAANVRKYQHWWSGIKTNRTCLLCLSARPECVAPCGHSYCENCTRRFSQKLHLWGERYEVSSCLLCGSAGWSTKIKPCTAGVNILGIDGGGTRGIIPLEFLTLIQSRLGNACDLQELFDLILGTSSGM